MKKLILLLLVTLCSCSNIQTKKEEQLSISDKTLILINQAIDDYNNDRIEEKENKYKKSISRLPVEIDKIEPIKNLNELKKIKNKDVTSTTYEASYSLGKYDMIFKIYNYGDDFFQYGETAFTINLDDVVVNDPQFNDIRNILKPLLDENRSVLTWLYGLDVTLGEESTVNKGYYKILKIGPYENIKTINALKEKAESIFTKDFLEISYKTAFENEDSIYKEINNELYCIQASILDIQEEGKPYDITKIVATKEKQDTILIDILLSLGDYTLNEVNRIVLIKTETGYRFNIAY